MGVFLQFKVCTPACDALQTTSLIVGPVSALALDGLSFMAGGSKLVLNMNSVKAVRRTDTRDAYVHTPVRFYEPCSCWISTRLPQGST